MKDDSAFEGGLAAHQKASRPRNLGPIRTHVRLATEMAGVTGADLQRAMDEGRLTQDDWAGMVQRCRGCLWAEGCPAWMAAQGYSNVEAPEACENHQRFRSLVSEQRD